MLSWSSSKSKYIINWYDPATNRLQIASEITNLRQSSSNVCCCVAKDQFVFIMGGQCQSVDMLDTSLQSHSWVHKLNFSVRRPLLRVGVLNDCIYAVCCTYIILLVICYECYLYYILYRTYARLAVIMKIILIPIIVM